LLWCTATHALPGLNIQVSTSGVLVQGIYERAVSNRFLLNYGDFGIGTFENLDDEMAVLDGAIYLKQIGEQDRVDDKTAFVIKRR
jgi:acetolactate decarboxylase